MRDSSGLRCLRGRRWVSGVWTPVSSGTGSGGRCTCAFGWLDVLLYDAAHALILGAHVGADADELDRVAEAHLALWVHAALPDKALAELGSHRFDLCLLALLQPAGATKPTCSRRFA
jgi:hypothetical protein